MPIATIREAREEIYDHFIPLWTPTGVLLLFQDKQKPTIPTTEVSWARITITHVDRDRVTLGDETGNRRFRSFGIITIEIYAVVGDGLTSSDDLVNIAVNAFEGAKTGEDRVTFRNVSHNEIGEDGPWFQTNVTAEFDYDFVK